MLHVTEARGQWRSRGDNHNGKSRLYIFHDGETIIENLFERHRRPVDVYKEVLPEIFTRLKMDPRKARWSQKAGCACGCSPGFILEGEYGRDYFVTVSGKSSLEVM
jgi:hypothetical protein